MNLSLYFLFPAQLQREIGICEYLAFSQGHPTTQPLGKGLWKPQEEQNPKPQHWSELHEGAAGGIMV